MADKRNQDSGENFEIEAINIDRRERQEVQEALTEGVQAGKPVIEVP